MLCPREIPRTHRFESTSRGESMFESGLEEDFENGCESHRSGATVAKTGRLRFFRRAIEATLERPLLTRFHTIPVSVLVLLPN